MPSTRNDREPSSARLAGAHTRHAQAAPKAPAAAYLARRHFSASLADRLQRRPFLVGVERLWLIYQLLDALAHAHARGVVHGDVRSENIMVAEWCFCVLVDFAAHKPATLRDDGPAVLEHFAAGDGAQRAARCYVAPERLVRDLSPETGGSLRPPADVFAAGCVAAEILNGGAPTLDVAAALALARAPVDRARPPPPAVLALRPAAARAAVAAMLARDPDARGGAADHAACLLYTSPSPRDRG